MTGSVSKCLDRAR